MKRMIAAALFAALTVTTLPAFADNNHPDRPAPSRPAPQRQAPPPPPRIAPPARVAPPTRVAPPAPHQFPLNNDLHKPVYHAPITARPGAPAYHAPTNNVVNRPPANVQPHPFGPPRTGRVITRPHYSRAPWGWNRNVVWSPAPTYWGGGFWGPYGFDVIYVPLGAFVYNDYSYDSYMVQPGTPGAQLLAAYQLTQTPCGPPDLVVIWGPDDSVICAYPNNLVGPGQYTIDPTTLTLVSSGS